MVAEAGGDMVCMEDQVVFFVCVKDCVCLEGWFWFLKESFPPWLGKLELSFSLKLFILKLEMLGTYL
jgi:hypothetical protein